MKPIESSDICIYQGRAFLWSPPLPMLPDLVHWIDFGGGRQKIAYIRANVFYDDIVKEYVTTKKLYYHLINPDEWIK